MALVYTEATHAALYVQVKAKPGDLGGGPLFCQFIYGNLFAQLPICPSDFLESHHTTRRFDQKLYPNVSTVSLMALALPLQVCINSLLEVNIPGDRLGAAGIDVGPEIWIV